jgi:hypothetical protein
MLPIGNRNHEEGSRSLRIEGSPTGIACTVPPWPDRQGRPGTGEPRLAEPSPDGAGPRYRQMFRW